MSVEEVKCDCKGSSDLAPHQPWCATNGPQNEVVNLNKVTYSFDSKCFDLAEHFLPQEATPAVKNELAQAIQDAVENFYGGYPSNIPVKP